MLQNDRFNFSEGNDLNKISKRKECNIWHY